MKCVVACYSKTGSTRRLALAIADQLGCAAQSVEECRIDGPVDVLFLGGAVYATYDHDYAPPLLQFIRSLDRNKVRQVAPFVTYAFGSSLGMLKEHIRKAGLAVSERSFECRGRFLFFNLRRPNEKDLQAARTFAKSFQ